MAPLKILDALFDLGSAPGNNLCLRSPNESLNADFSAVMEDLGVVSDDFVRASEQVINEIETNEQAKELSEARTTEPWR